MSTNPLRINLIWWGKWEDYPKVRIGNNEYAEIENRLYTRHAVDYFLPSGRRSVGNVDVTPGEGGAALTQGRSISPNLVEQAISNGSTRIQLRKGTTRTVHTLGDLEVVTENGGKIVVTVSYRTK